MEIRKATESDEEGIISLFNLCFGRELTHEEWAWKYKDSPWGSTAIVAADGDKVVAHYGGLKMKFYSPKQDFDVYQPCDVMTHPKYRARFAKRGAMVKAGELFYSINLMDFAFGFPSERHAILGTKQLRYTEHGYVTVLSKKVLFKPRVNLFLKVEKGWNSVKESELDSLWQEVRDDYDLTIEKNSRYIFWRYRDHPARQYEPMLVRSRYRGALKAFAVFFIKEHELSILDFFCGKGLNAKTLLKIFETVAVQHDAGVIKVWLNPHEDVFQTLTDYGYRGEKGVPYIFKILNEEITPSFLFNRYCYRMGDYDAS